MLHIATENSTFRAIWDYFVPFQATEKFQKSYLYAYLSDFKKNYIIKKYILRYIWLLPNITPLYGKIAALGEIKTSEECLMQ